MLRASLVIVLLLAGCTSGPAPNHSSAAAVGCMSLPNLAAGLPCPNFLTATNGASVEASIAAHPIDPDTLVVAWTERNSTVHTAHVWAAFSHDRGVTWARTRMHDPSQTFPGATEAYSFDVTTAFGPDGTAYVLYGGETLSVPNPVPVPSPPVRLLPTETVPITDRITLASTHDGATWTYHAVAVAGSSTPWYAFATDFMSVAVAPDTGHIYVVSDVASAVVQGTGQWLWRSNNGGVTWSSQVLHPAEATEGQHAFPRVGAGSGGRVDVASEADLPDGSFSHWMDESTDDGSTFTMHRLPTNLTRVGRGMPILSAEGHTFVARTADAIVALRSGDGVHWTLEKLAPGDDQFAWFSVAALRGHTLAALTQRMDCDAHMGLTGDGAPEPWEMRLALEHGGAGPSGQGGTIDDRNVTLKQDHGPYKCYNGNDYAGLAFGADGTLWGAWSDVRGSAQARIAVAPMGTA